MQLMTLEEAFAYTRRSKSRFYEDVKRGIFKVVYIGPKPLVVKEQIDAMVRKQLNA